MDEKETGRKLGGRRMLRSEQTRGAGWPQGGGGEGGQGLRRGVVGECGSQGSDVVTLPLKSGDSDAPHHCTSCNVLRRPGAKPPITFHPSSDLSTW